jgi:hypothetical protein
LIANICYSIFVFKNMSAELDLLKVQLVTPLDLASPDSDGSPTWTAGPQGFKAASIGMRDCKPSDQRYHLAQDPYYNPDAHLVFGRAENGSLELRFATADSKPAATPVPAKKTCIADKGANYGCVPVEDGEEFWGWRCTNGNWRSCVQNIQCTGAAQYSAEQGTSGRPDEGCSKAKAAPALTPQPTPTFDINHPKDINLWALCSPTVIVGGLALYVTFRKRINTFVRNSISWFKERFTSHPPKPGMLAPELQAI